MGDEATLGDLRNRIAEFVAAREWEPFHNPKDLALALSVEASELLELFQWQTREEIETLRGKMRKPIADELADVFIYGLSMANALSLDLTEAILHKIEKNEKRFPEERFRRRPPGGPRGEWEPPPGKS